MLPNFLIIGAQKSGTSAIYHCLRKHPDIFLPDKKEIHFFSDDYKYKKGLSYYESFFSGYKGEKAIGEATPRYLYEEKVPERIAKNLQDVKLIVCLRNPIHRAFSAYWMNYKRGTEVLEFESALKQNPIYIEFGFYYRGLMRYLDFFSEERILVLIYEDLTNNPEKFYKMIFKFLNVNINFIPSGIHQRFNVFHMPRSYVLLKVIHFAYNLRNFSRDMGLGFIIDTPLIRDRLRRIRNRVTRSSSVATSKPQMKPETEKYLAEVFHNENQKLSRFIGRDLLSIWT